MRSVFDVLARHVEPSLRRSLVGELLRRGVTGSAIARCLGVSPSLVTRYSKGERGLHELSAIPEVAEGLRRLADGAASGSLCGPPLYAELAMLAMLVMSRKYACGIHHLISRDVNPATCDVCPRLFGRLFTAAKPA